MSRGRAGLGAGLLGLLLAGPGLAWAQPSAVDLLAQVKAATGGSRWDSIRVVSAVGEKTSSGLRATFSSAEDLATGRYARRADYGLLANGEGVDAGGRWRMDNSRIVHSLDSDEAATVAVTEAWLAARGYLFPERTKAQVSLDAPASVDGQVFDRVIATPEGGRAVTLWIGRADHRLGRAVIALDNRIETLRYGDYRVVDGLMLPFDIATENGDQQESGDVRVARYVVDGPLAPDAISRPSEGPHDALLRDGAVTTAAPFGLDPLSGFPIVAVSLNGAPPMPFILDTGGHDILTPAAAKALGLPLSGAGVTFGAGEGSTPSRFTKVASVRLGQAEMTAQPFIVLDLNLGQAMGADRHAAPIAGVIGLELFERFTVTLDYAAHRLTLSRPAAEPIAGGVPIRFTGDMPLVQGRLDGREGWFGLDSGNNVEVILFRPWVEAHGLAAWFEVSVDAPAAGVGGPLAFRRGHAGRLSFAGVETPGLPVLLAGDHMGSLSSRGAAGNIGESVLSHYVVTFDYAHERVRLEPTNPAS